MGLDCSPDWPQGGRELAGSIDGPPEDVDLATMAGGWAGCDAAVAQLQLMSPDTDIFVRAMPGDIIAHFFDI